MVFEAAYRHCLAILTNDVSSQGVVIGGRLILGLLLTCSGFSLRLAIINDASNCFRTYSHGANGYRMNTSQSCAFLSLGQGSCGQAWWPSWSGYGPLARYVKLRFAHAPKMPGTFSPPLRVSDPDMHHGTCVTHVPWCMPGSLNIGCLWSRWQDKRSRHSRRMRNPQFYVYGKRSIPNLHCPLLRQDRLVFHQTWDIQRWMCVKDIM